VRQGCPLSMFLFVIYIEPLIQMINSNTAGTMLQQNAFKCMAYADDINFILTSDEEADQIFDGIDIFCKESNAKLNFQKSSFMRINNCAIGPQLIEERDCLKILGFTLFSDLKITTGKNYEKLFNNINYMINLHQRRNLNFIQKIWFYEYICFVMVHKPDYPTGKRNDWKVEENYRKIYLEWTPLQNRQRSTFFISEKRWIVPGRH
jgi:Reverse transcriptase (RNA-dependent DNA polymerase)